MTGSVVFRLVYPLFANVCFAIGLRLWYILYVLWAHVHIRTRTSPVKRLNSGRPRA